MPRLKHQLAHAERGQAPSYVDFDAIPVVNQACVFPGGPRWAHVRFHDPEKVDCIDSWLQQDDVLVNATGTGTLGRVTFVESIPFTRVFHDGHVAVLRPHPEELDAKFLYYWLSIRQDFITANAAEGATNQIELSLARLGEFRLEAPCVQRQRIIADFLDRETAKIDALIGGVNVSEDDDSLVAQYVRLLRERRAALISEAVTGKITMGN